MRHLSLVPFLLVTSACLSTDAASIASSEELAAPIVAAERSFAERHKAVPLKQAFQEYAAADGVAIRPDGVRNVQEDLAAWPDNDDKGSIGWWPKYAGAARSGDLGFTTGPATYPGGTAGGYFTIWKKQPDGGWKWVIDQGQGQNGNPPFSPPDAPVQIVPLSDVTPMDPAAAWKALLAVDTELGKAMAEDVRALATRLAPDAYLMGFGKAPATNAEAADRILSGRPTRIAMKPEGGGVSAAGDFGWTYGYGDWTDDKGKAKKGSYLRAWQRRSGGWRIVADNLNPFGRN